MTIRRVLLALLLTRAVSVQGSAIALPQADGGELRLSRAASRIVTLSPHLAEGVFAAGAGDALIATVAFSEFPPQAAVLPRVGDAFRLDVERILALHPDLVIAWESGNPHAAVTQLTDLGVPVWTVEIREPSGIPDFIERVGQAAATPEPANAEARRLRELLADLAARYAAADPVRFFYQVEPKPLFTINGAHLISQGLALCGAANVFADQPALAFQVSREAVILADPDALLAPQLPGQGDPLASWRDWAGLRAVQRNALFLVPADDFSRATPRFIEALVPACRRLDGLRSTTNAATRADTQH